MQGVQNVLGHCAICRFSVPCGPNVRAAWALGVTFVAGSSQYQEIETWK